MTKKLAIIGAGPAGIYTALLLRNWPGEIHLFDQNRDIGEKLKTTGGGRMNVTNQCFGVDQFTGTSNNLLKRLFKNPHFQNREQILQRLGIEYQWEKKRAILQSQNAPLEVARLKQNLLAQPNLHLYLNHKCIKIETNKSPLTPRRDLEGLKSSQNNSPHPPLPPRGGAYQLTFETPIHEKPQKREVQGDIEAQSASYQSIRRSSTGDDNTEIRSFSGFSHILLAGGAMYRLRDLSPKDKIYSLPLQLGHTITEVSPSLSPLVFIDKKLRTLAGTSFEGTLTDPKNKKSITDDILITHVGLSGPAVLDFSAVRTSDQIELAFISNYPETTARAHTNTARQGAHRVRTWLRRYLTQRLSDFILEVSEISLESNFSDLSKNQVKKLLQNLYHYPIQNVQTKNYPSSWTTKGGVPLSEIQTATLESKLHPRVHFAGEILDCNGLCGGYNISFAAVSAQIVADAIMGQN